MNHVYQNRNELLDKLLAAGTSAPNDGSSGGSVSSSDSDERAAGRPGCRHRQWQHAEHMIDEHLQEVYDKLPNLEKQIWGKLIVMEHNRRTAKAYLRHPVISIDGQAHEFDGLRIGLSYFENGERTAAVKEIHSDLDQGIKLKIDPDGNLWAKRLCTTPVFLKPLYRNRPNDLFVIDQRPVKVFDIRRFKEILMQEMKQSVPDRKRLERCCCVCLKFSVDHFDLLRTPCWLLVVHLVSIELLNLVLPKDNDISSPSSSFMAPSPPPSLTSPTANQRSLTSPNANQRVQRARVGGVSKRIERSRAQQPPPTNFTSNSSLHIQSPEQAAFERLGTPPTSSGGSHYANQQHSSHSHSMLDLRQINKYMVPPYFDRANPQRQSRGGPGHQRVYEQRRTRPYGQQRHHSMSDVHVMPAHNHHHHNNNINSEAAMRAQMLNRWRSQDSGIG